MKRILLFLFLLVVLAGGWYAYKIYTGKVKSLTEVKADTTISAADLIAAFTKDTASANKQYLGKVLQVNGPIKSVEKESATIVLGNNNSSTSVRCSMDSAYVKEIISLNAGRLLSIKGACTGYNADEMGLGSDIVLNRCVLVPNK